MMQTDEVLKNQVVGFGVAIPTILILFSLGAGASSVLLGGAAAVAALIFKMKKEEVKS